jgi:hypothetical protein
MTCCLPLLLLVGQHENARPVYPLLASDEPKKIGGLSENDPSFKAGSSTAA